MGAKVAVPPPAEASSRGRIGLRYEIEVLGRRGLDRITGFEGVITGRTRYISGCDQVLLSPRVKDDGSLKDAAWFDVQRVEILDDEPIELDNSETPGADMPAPIR